ncbi:MAG: Fic family protein [Armatimonadota bacterium]
MERGPTGRYQISNAGGEQIRAFIPDPLPPQPPLHFGHRLLNLLERANLALGRLDSVGVLLPDPELFLYTYVRREAVLSSQIEGTQSSLSDLLLFEIAEVPGIPVDDVVEVCNYVAALEHGIARIREGFPLCNRLIREMHAKLLSSGRGSEKAPGDFRRTQNWIGGTRPGNATFVPPPPELVPECMAALERFLHEGRGTLPSAVRAALAHVQFETIHPFLDGNGRLGRLLIAFVLHDEGILRRPLLYLSLFFKEHRSDYYRLLDDVRLRGEWEAWLEFFLEGVAHTADNAVHTAQRLVALFEEDFARLKASSRGSASTRAVLEALRQRPLLTVPELCRRTGLSFPTVNKSLKLLEQMGITREVTTRQRNRVFEYTKYLAILNEGTEQPAG